MKKGMGIAGERVIVKVPTPKRRSLVSKRERKRERMNEREKL